MQPLAPVEDETTPVDGGTVVRRLEGDISTLNPLLTASRSEHYVAFYLFTPLLQFDANLLPTTSGSLTDKYEVSQDGRDYTFHLNPKATFSDGTPVRASDVLFTLRKIVDPKSEAAGVAGGFQKLDLSRSHAPDD
ncbi:MAG: ABC transporter substrate-binding protein, partial [Sciscionella sp.]